MRRRHHTPEQVVRKLCEADPSGHARKSRVGVDRLRR